MLKVDWSGCKASCGGLSSCGGSGGSSETGSEHDGLFTSDIGSSGWLVDAALESFSKSMLSMTIICVEVLSIDSVKVQSSKRFLDGAE